MFDWLNGEGAVLKTHLPGSTNYLTNLKERNPGTREPDKAAAGMAEGGKSSGSGKGAAALGGAESSEDRPFPLNPSFVSESILSEELRNEIYKRVVAEKKSVRAVSVELGVDMRRVGAVVRLVELETRWRKEAGSLFSLFFFFFRALVTR
jgi:hypothetical protein